MCHKKGLFRVDILQLYYFMNIVECNFNLSLAAKKIHISQPALSQFVSSFEKENEVKLFFRKNGRLQGLTEAGEHIYQYALKILSLADELNHVIHYASLRQKGTIRIGLPSLILENYFSGYFPKLSVENQDIQVTIVEQGSHVLRRQLIKEELDMAILIEPTMLDEDAYEQHIISIDEMVAFINKHHPLKHQEKITWQDLDDYPIATFNDNFMTHQLVTEQLAVNEINRPIQLTSSSWAYLMEATHETDIVTILPRPIVKHIDQERCIERQFKKPIPFNFTICRLKRDKYEPVKDHIYNQIIKFFYQPYEND